MPPQPTDGSQRLRTAGLCEESSAKVLNKVEPRFDAAVEPRKDRVELRRNPAGFVQSQLTTSPVHQLEVLIKRHEQATTIGEPTMNVAVAGLLTWRFERNRG